jgi:hypothetical protein
MHDRAGRSPTGPMLPMMQGMNESRCALTIREHLAIAKLDRARLAEESATTMQVNFRSC